MKRSFSGLLAKILPILWACAGCGDDRAALNLQPVAVAGADQTVEVRTEAILDGSRSFDPDGDPIFFEWELLGASDQAWLSRADQALVRLTPRVEGVFLVRLTVDDGTLKSEPDIVRVFSFESQVACQADADCDDDNPCTDDSCGPSLTCIFEPNQDSCDDGLFCTTGDYCDGTGVCVGAGSPCLEECLTACNEDEQSCEISPDGTPCGQGGCQDGDWVGEVCEAGACTGQDTIVCNDQNECTEDSCVDSSGCLNADLPDTTPCNAGLGVCCSGQCTGSAECCQDSDCGETTDCAVYRCQAGQCSSLMVDAGLPCDGGDGDRCDSTCDGNGGCVDHAVDCDDGEYCNGAETCDPATGSCQSSGNLGGGAHCLGDQVVTCDGNGSTIDAETCALGCNDQVDPVHCYQVDPSNFDSDLMCANSNDAVLSGQVVIDTDNQTITGVGAGNIVSSVVSQIDPAKELVVFSFNRLEIESGAYVDVVGHRALALAVCTDVILHGPIDLNAAGQTGGPGGFGGGDPSSDGQGPAPGRAAGDGTTECPRLCTAGAGGGSFGDDAGDGGSVSCEMDGDLVQLTGGEDGDGHGNSELIPLIGGSGGAGGARVTEEDSTAPGPGGGGGGAVQITAGGRISIGPGAGITAGGAGGGETISGGGAGGGAGGAILLEAAVVELADGAYLAANGGGGGGGDCT